MVVRYGKVVIDIGMGDNPLVDISTVLAYEGFRLRVIGFLKERYSLLKPAQCGFREFCVCLYDVKIFIVEVGVFYGIVFNIDTILPFLYGFRFGDYGFLTDF